MERLSGEPAYCNPPTDAPKWTVDANSFESESDVLEDGQVMEPTESLLTESLELPIVLTDQSNTVVTSESDSDFDIEQECN